MLLENGIHVISYRWNRHFTYKGFRDINDQMYRGHELELSRSCDIFAHVIIRFALWGSMDTDPNILDRFRDINVSHKMYPSCDVTTLTFQRHVTSSITSLR